MVPMHATASPSQVEYIVNDAKIRVLFVGEQFQYNNAYKVQQECPVLEKIIVLDRNVVLKPEDKSSIYFDDFIATGDNSESLALVNARLPIFTAAIWPPSSTPREQRASPKG